jgi:hypothetical protein
MRDINPSPAQATRMMASDRMASSAVLMRYFQNSSEPASEPGSMGLARIALGVLSALF